MGGQFAEVFIGQCSPPRVYRPLELVCFVFPIDVLGNLTLCLFINYA